jgi:hypothetical protein
VIQEDSNSGGAIEEGTNNEGAVDEEGMNVEDQEVISTESQLGKPEEALTVSQELARQLVLRELKDKSNNIGTFDAWDPLAQVIDVEKRKWIIQQLEINYGFASLLGEFTPPLKGKGTAIYNRDNALYRMMSDAATVMKGLGKVMSLMLDGKYQDAVVLAARALVLQSHLLSRLNSERLRIHYPRDLVNKILKPKAEPILRNQHRLKAKQLAQEVRDTNVVLRNYGGFFRRGGKGSRARNSFTAGTRKFSRSTPNSFPQQQQQQYRQRWTKPVQMENSKKAQKPAWKKD